MAASARRSFRYSVDRRDSIVSVDAAWLEFARQNGASELTREAVLGRSLWDFVVGPETRYLYGLVLARVRANDTAVTLPFRCDSPELRRHMRLVVSPLDEDRVQFDGVLVREERRTHVALFDPQVPRSREFVGICSWCKRVRARPDEWVEVEDAIARMNLFQEPALPQFTHSICDSCNKGIHATLGDDETG